MNSSKLIKLYSPEIIAKPMVFKDLGNTGNRS